MNPKNYILSERLSYLALGALVGYFIGKNRSPIDYYMIVGFVLLAVLISWWIKKR